MKIAKKNLWLLELLLLSFGCAALVFMIFPRIQVLQNLDTWLNDQFMLFVGERNPHKEILIVQVDDESVKKYGDPVPREKYVSLIQKLTAFGAKTIGFDLLFRDAKIPQIDARLARMTDSTGNVVHCFMFADTELGNSEETPALHEKYALKSPIPPGIELTEAVDATFPNACFLKDFNQAGFFTAMSDPDGRVRRMPLFMEYQGKIYPAFGLVVLLNFLNTTPESLRIEKDFRGLAAIIETPTQTLRVPMNNQGQVMLNFYGSLENYQTTSLYNLLQLLEAIPATGNKIVLPNLAGKIILIGPTEFGDDEHVTPFSSQFYGIGFHATLLSNILKGDLIREASWLVNLLVALVLAIALLLSAFIWLKMKKSIWFFAVIAVLLILFFNLTAFFIFYKTFHLWLKAMQINSSLLVLGVALLFIEKVVRVRNLKSKIQNLENQILNRISLLDKLEEKIDSSTGQFKVVDYFAAQLRPIIEEPELRAAKSLEKVFPKFLEAQEIIKEKLAKQVEQLKAEKQQIEREKEKLEMEKQVYEKFLKGDAKRGKMVQTAAKPETDVKHTAKEIMAAASLFQKHLKEGGAEKFIYENIVSGPTTLIENGKSVRTPIGELFDKINLLSSYDSTILISGEHGTGKELVAKAIHRQSKRVDRRLVVLNCAAIPENLLESELFGHVKGAFTHAINDRVGAFELADGGTIFLDEIGELKMDLQSKLLRVLQERQFQKVGSSKTVQVNVRVIAATNRNLEKMIKNNEFRDDLYFRLKVVDLHLPSLRERRIDIPFLIHHFLAEFNTQYKKQKTFSNEAILAAISFDWPGNVRMLQHFVENVCVMTTSDIIQVSDFPEEIQNKFRKIFQSDEIQWRQQIEAQLEAEKQRLLELCHSSLRDNRVEDFNKSPQLQVNQKTTGNCYDYLKIFVRNLASVYSDAERDDLVRKMIVAMQEDLFQWCRQEKLGKLSDLYSDIEKLLGRTRRQIDNWGREG